MNVLCPSNYGHHSGPANQRPKRRSRCQPWDVDDAKRLPRNSPQKAMDEELMEQVVTQDNATAAWLAVTRNGGAPGIDGLTTEQLNNWGFASTRKGRSKSPPRVWNDSKRKCESYGEAARVRPATSCGTLGGLTSEAGGGITAWPRNAGTSLDWRARFDDTSAAAFGNDGTTGVGGCASYANWD